MEEHWHASEGVVENYIRDFVFHNTTNKQILAGKKRCQVALEIRENTFLDACDGAFTFPRTLGRKRYTVDLADIAMTILYLQDTEVTVTCAYPYE